MTPATHSAAPPKKASPPAAEAVATATRHLVYQDVISWLPIASVGQVDQFLDNLYLREPIYLATEQQPERRAREIDRLRSRFRNLRVSPELAEVDAWRGGSKRTIEIELARKFGGRLAGVAGFYFDERWRLNLPTGCAFHPYRSRTGFANGILCQPLNRGEQYFLLSSAKFGGEKAIRLRESDREFFDSFKDYQA